MYIFSAKALKYPFAAETVHRYTPAYHQNLSACGAAVSPDSFEISVEKPPPDNLPNNSAQYQADYS